MAQRITEAKAKRKWCRHGRIMTHLSQHSGVASTSINRYYKDNKHDGPATFCFGSDCMAWDWHDPESAGEERRGYCDAEEL